MVLNILILCLGPCLFYLYIKIYKNPALIEVIAIGSVLKMYVGINAIVLEVFEWCSSGIYCWNFCDSLSYSRIRVDVTTNFKQKVQIESARTRASVKLTALWFNTATKDHRSTPWVRRSANTTRKTETRSLNIQQTPICAWAVRNRRKIQALGRYSCFPLWLSASLCTGGRDIY